MIVARAGVLVRRAATMTQKAPAAMMKRAARRVVTETPLR